MPMPSVSANRTRALPFDLLIVAGLASLDVVARIAPHAPNFTPVAASALFAAAMLHRRALAPLVPVLGLAIGDWIVGGYDTKIMVVVYAALAWPACASGLVAHAAHAADDRAGSRLVIAFILRHDKFCRLGIQPALRAEHRRPEQMLHRRAAVPAQHARRRSVLGPRSVRRLLAGANAAAGGQPSDRCHARPRLRAAASVL